MRRGPVSGSRARSRSSVSWSRWPGPWPPGTTRTRRCQLSIRSGPLSARSIDGAGGASRGPARGAPIAGDGGCVVGGWPALGAGWSTLEAGWGALGAGAPGVPGALEALGTGRREDGRPQRGTPAGPGGPCVSWATSMGGGAIGRGPAAAGPMAAGTLAPERPAPGRPAGGPPGAGPAIAGPATAGVPGAGSLSTWPGMAGRRPGEIARDAVRPDAGVAGPAGPAAPGEVAGPLQAGADRPVPRRAVGAARPRAAR